MRLKGYRKWSIIAGVIVVGVVFRLANLLSGAEFVTLIQTTVVAFVSGNGVEHACTYFAPANQPDNPDAR
jgi:hypothetical protein